jgi:hypothetical protein
VLWGGTTVYSAANLGAFAYTEIVIDPLATAASTTLELRLRNDAASSNWTTSRSGRGRGERGAGAATFALLRRRLAGHGRGTPQEGLLGRSHEYLSTSIGAGWLFVAAPRDLGGLGALAAEPLTSITVATDKGPVTAAHRRP